MPNENHNENHNLFIMVIIKKQISGYNKLKQINIFIMNSKSSYRLCTQATQDLAS